MKNAVEADMLSVANYIGGWDGFTVLGGDDSDLFQRQLLYPSQVVEPEMEHIVGERLKQGRAPGKSENAMKIGIYEYGPGYAMPSAEKPFVDESEEVGKSLALGIATLDMHLVWLNDYGFEGPQGFFNFATGINWTSHTDGNSMRPFASWQGLELRNRFCPGDLIKVDAKEVKTLTIPDALAMSINWKGEKKEIKVKGCENIQMVRCYAFQKEKQHSILLLNRSFKETRTVKVTMPYSPQSKVDIHRLAYHEPRATNRDELLYKIESEEKNDFAQTYTIQLPPSSAMVLVNEEK